MAVAVKPGRLLSVVASMLSLVLISAVKTGISTSLVRRQGSKETTDNSGNDHWADPASGKMHIVPGANSLFSDGSNYEADLEVTEQMTHLATNRKTPSQCLENSMDTSCGKGSNKIGIDNLELAWTPRGGIDPTECQTECTAAGWPRFSFTHEGGWCKCCKDTPMTTEPVDFGITIGDVDCTKADPLDFLTSYNTNIQEDGHDITNGPWNNRLTCLESCRSNDLCSCVVHSYQFQTCRLREECKPSTLITSNANTVYVAADDGYQDFYVKALEYTDSKKHCTRIRMCELELVGDGKPYNEDEMCECNAAYFSGLDTGSLDCSEWEACLKKHEDMVFIEILILAHEAQQQAAAGAAAAALVQQNTGHHDPATCRLPNAGCILVEDDSDCKDPFGEKDCECFADLTSACTNQGTLSLSDEALYDCKRLHMCRNEHVCCSWKWNPTADGNTGQCTGQDDMTTAEKNRCGYTSLLAVHDTGNADKADVAPIADIMHGRRQPPAMNSSAVPMASLEGSVRRKSCARSAR